MASLLAAGARVDLTDRGGNTASDVAQDQGSAVCVSIIDRHLVDSGRPSATTDAPLDEASLRFMGAVSRGDTSEVRRMVEQGQDVNIELASSVDGWYYL